MPQGGQFTPPEDVAGLPHAPGRREGCGFGNDGPDLARLEAGPGGIGVALVGQGRVAQHFPGPPLVAVLREDGGDLHLGVVGQTGDLFLDQQRSWCRSPESNFLMRHQAQPATTNPAATPRPRSTAFQVSPSQTQK